MSHADSRATKIPTERDLLHKLLGQELDRTVEEIRADLEQTRARFQALEAELKRKEEEDEDRELEKAMPRRG